MAAATINAQCRKNFKAGNWTHPRANRITDCGWRLTRSARRTLLQEAFEDDDRAKAAAIRAEARRRAEIREERRQERMSPLPRPNFLKRALNFMKGLAA